MYKVKFFDDQGQTPLRCNAVTYVCLKTVGGTKRRINKNYLWPEWAKGFTVHTLDQYRNEVDLVVVSHK